MPHGDYTGNQKDALAAQFHEEQKTAAARMSVVSQVRTATLQDTIDLTDQFVPYDPKSQAPWIQEDSDTVVVDATHPLDEPVEFQCSDDVEGVTLGKGSLFDLKTGQKYRVPRWVYDHLEEKALVRH